jgi:hypothetical protein
MRAVETAKLIGFLPLRDDLDGSCYKYYAYLMGRYGGVLLSPGDHAAREVERFRPDLLFVHGDWSQTYRIALDAGIPYVLVSQDVSSMRRELSPEELAAEKEMFENAASVVFTSRGHVPFCQDRFRLPPYDVISLRPLARDVAFTPSGARLPGKTLAYSGGLVASAGRNGNWGYKCYLDDFRRFLEAEWEVHLYPDTGSAGTAEDYAAIGCTLHPFLPYPLLLRDLGRYSAGFLGYVRRDVPEKAFAYTQTCMPNKLWDYLAAGIPTIGYNLSEDQAATVRPWGVLASDPDDLVQSAEEAIDRAEALGAEISRRRFDEVIDADGPTFDEIVERGFNAPRRAPRNPYPGGAGGTTRLKELYRRWVPQPVRASVSRARRLTGT